jgi:hypothetical protein
MGKVSSTGVGITSPIVVYEDDKEARDVSSNYLRVYPARVATGVGDTSSSLYVTSVDPEDLSDADKKAEEAAAAAKDGTKLTKKAPTLMDIEVVSNTVVYDASKNPSATVVFKVRNSSGEDVKAVNARVKVL